MEHQDQLRNTFIQQSDEQATKQRFGLFSQPLSTAVGDNGPYQTTLHPKGSDNKPLTQPRNIVTAASRSGQGDTCFFGPLNPLLGTVKTEGDREVSISNKEGRKHPVYGHLHEKDFIPAPTNKVISKPAYPYKEENPLPKNPKRNRNSEGNVNIQPKNMVTNATSTIERTLFRPLKHLDDPFENAKTQALEQNKKPKGIHHQHAFNTTAHGHRPFSKDRQIYGTEVKFGEKRQRPQSHNYLKHQNRFKYSNPTKWGIFGYFTAFPPHMPNPPKEMKRPPKEGEKKECFKTMSVAKSRPSSSITTNPMNIRRYVNNSFSHRF